MNGTGYDVIEGDGLETLIRAVEERMFLGWVPIGAAFFVPEFDGQRQWFQTMYKPYAELPAIHMEASR